VSWEQKARWSSYVLAFLALWSGNVAVSLASKLPARDVRDVLLRDAIVPAVVTLLWFLSHLDSSKQDKG
jgi:hypothetical protein